MNLLFFVAVGLGVLLLLGVFFSFCFNWCFVKKEHKKEVEKV